MSNARAVVHYWNMQAPPHKPTMTSTALTLVLEWAVECGCLREAAGSFRDLHTRYHFIRAALDAGIDAELLAHNIRATCRACAQPAIDADRRARDFGEAVVDNLVMAEEYRQAVELGI